MGVQRGKADRAIARIAEKQHGSVAREQLLAAGLSRREIEVRVRSGLLLPVHRGVYVVNYGPRAALALETAAVLACRPRAMLSHRSAGCARRLPIPAPTKIEVTVVGRKQAAPRGVTTYSIAQIHPSELDRHERIPITSPSLTLLDLAGVLAPDVFLGALHEARVKEIVTDRQLRATLERHPNRRGARALREILASEGGVKVTRSKPERRTLRLMRAHGIEPDASNHWIGPYEVDFWFEAERVAVEFDSRRYHNNSKRFVTDRRRNRYLAARDITTVALTDEDLGEAMRELRETLAARRRALPNPTKPPP